MPRPKEAARGVIRYRTVKTPGGKYFRVSVVRKPGPRGGHTVAGPIHTKEG